MHFKKPHKFQLCLCFSSCLIRINIKETENNWNDTMKYWKTVACNKLSKFVCPGAAFVPGFFFSFELFCYVKKSDRLRFSMKNVFFKTTWTFFGAVLYFVSISSSLMLASNGFKLFHEDFRCTILFCVFIFKMQQKPTNLSFRTTCWLYLCLNFCLSTKLSFGLKTSRELRAELQCTKCSKGPEDSV